MKIVLIRQRYNPHGGAERFVSGALGALKRHTDVEVHLIGRSWQAIEGIRFHRCDPFYLGRLSRDAGFAYYAGKKAANLQPDLIQSHERLSVCHIYRAGDGVHREWLKQKTRFDHPVKRWVTLCNPYHLYIQYAERKLYTSPELKAVICNSHMVKNEILQYFSIDPGKIHVIHNSVDTQAFHPALPQERSGWRKHYGIPENASVFLFVGSGFERKGLAQAIRSLAPLPDSAYLAVVGHDKHESHYRALAATQQVGERVLFFGGQTDVNPFYALADAFILPTLYDPFSNAVLEAMACGLPIITSTKSGAAEILAEGKSGFICPLINDYAWIAAMLALTHREQAAAMGRSARSTAEHYDWSKTGDALVQLYQSLL